MADKIFIDGMIVRKPHPKAPDWVVASLAFNIGTFLEFADQHQKNGWLNVDINLSQKGEMYAALNEFTPKPKAEGIDRAPEEEIPF